MSSQTPTRSTYYKTAAALMLLLALTIVFSFIPLGDFGIVVAMTIAVAKALVIALFFMHLRYSSSLTMLFAGAGVLWLFILFALTFGDYITR